MLRAAAEIRICLISLYCGTLIGLMYDIFAFIRLPFNENRIIDAALDIMFYICGHCRGRRAALCGQWADKALFNNADSGGRADILPLSHAHVRGAHKAKPCKKAKIRAHLQNPCKNGKIRLEICAYMLYKYSIRDRCAPMRILPYKKGRYAA